MIRHIVLWRVKSPDEASFITIRSALQGQGGRIPGLLGVEIGRC
jgi:hypothetical protein